MGAAKSDPSVQAAGTGKPNAHGRVWLVQMNPQGAYNELARPADVTWPAVNNFLLDITPGDRVVMWVSGIGHRAGVFGLGIVDGPLEDRPHSPNYGDDGPEDRSVMRPSMPVRYTAIFGGPAVTRERLRQLREFRDFPLFRFAKGANPRVLNDAQWECIVSEISVSVQADDEPLMAERTRRPIC